MNIPAEFAKEFATFPAALRALVEAELAAGNSIVAIEHGFPAAPCGASIKLAREVGMARRASKGEISFYARNNSSYAGEFTTTERHFFVLEPPLQEPPPADMDAIRAAHIPPPSPYAEVVEPSGWTRVLHFIDRRAPHEVQFALERDLMALFTARMEGGQLRMNTTAHVNGARYDFEIQFIAARKGENHYTLRVVSEWPVSNSNHDYFRKTSDSWYKLWISELTPATPSDANDAPATRYQELCEAALNAERHLDTVEAVKRAIVDGVKRGGKYGTSHKEGGTNIFFQDGKFNCSDYGDNPDHKQYTDDAEFLKMLWNFSRFDVNRSAGKRELPELEVWKLILRRMSPPPMGPASSRSGALAALTGALAIPATEHATTTMQSLYSTPFAKWISIAVILLVVGGLAAWQMFSIKSTGTPLGPALRTATHVFQLISTTEPYMPGLHRDPSKNRFRIDLLVFPIADPEKQETFTLLRQQQSNALTPVTKILGVDGDVVWINALDTFAVNLKTKRVANSEDLRKANPELEMFLNSARPEFAERFVAVSPEWSYAYEFSSETLKANACAPPPRTGLIDEHRSGRIENNLCSGGLIAANDWIAIKTPEDIASDFKPGFSLPRDFSAGEKDRARHLYRGAAEASEERLRIQNVTLMSQNQYREGNFLRVKYNSGLLRAANPDSVFVVHRVGTELFAPYTLTRLSPFGGEIWNATTGIGRLDQVLPGDKTIVLKGDRTPVPGKVPEPIAVLVDVATGAVREVSLWRK